MRLTVAVLDAPPSWRSTRWTVSPGPATAVTSVTGPSTGTQHRQRVRADVPQGAVLLAPARLRERVALVEDRADPAPRRPGPAALARGLLHPRSTGAWCRAVTKTTEATPARSTASATASASVDGEGGGLLQQQVAAGGRGLDGQRGLHDGGTAKVTASTAANISAASVYGGGAVAGGELPRPSRGRGPTRPTARRPPPRPRPAACTSAAQYPVPTSPARTRVSCLVGPPARRGRPAWHDGLSGAGGRR